MKDIVLTDRGPKPIGPYSQAVKSNGFVFVSGQVALDPKTNEFVGSDVRQQTERVLENLKAILEASGVSLNHVVKTTVFLKDMNDFTLHERSLCALLHCRSTSPLYRPGRSSSQGCSRRNRPDRFSLIDSPCTKQKRPSRSSRHGRLSSRILLVLSPDYGRTALSIASDTAKYVAIAVTATTTIRNRLRPAFSGDPPFPLGPCAPPAPEGPCAAAISGSRYT